MEFQSEDEDEANSSNANASNSKTVEPASYDKICITPVLEQTEEFLKSTFTPMENKIQSSHNIPLTSTKT